MEPSCDGGASVLRSVAVSGSAYTYSERQQPESQFLLGLGYRADSSGSIWLGVATGRAQRTYYQVGDYGGMGVRSDGTFQPVWIDNRSGVPQIYTTDACGSRGENGPA